MSPQVTAVLRLTLMGERAAVLALAEIVKGDAT